MPASFLPPFRTFYDAYFKLGGSPSALTQAAQKWREFGNAAQTASDDLQAINNGEFLGSEGERYKKLVNADFPDHLAITSRAHLGVADAIEEYATDLAARIRNMDHVESVARLHHTDVNIAAKAVNDAEFAVLAAPTLEAKAAAELALAAAWSDYNGKVTLWERDLDATDEIKRVLGSNVDTHTSTIKAQEKKAFEPNPNAAVQFWNNVKDFAHEHADILKKVAAALSFIGGILAAFTPVGWIVAAVAVGIMALLAASGAGSWLDVAVEVAFMTPIGVAGRVVGAGIKATSAGARMMNAGSKVVSAGSKGLSTVKNASVQAAKAASRHSTNAVKAISDNDLVRSFYNRVTIGKPHCTGGDPIDMATGTMVDFRTDVFIDGVLPLVVDRNANSNHELGRALGPRWVSTMDVRIEICEDEVLMLAPDGALLTFPPAPNDGSEVRADGRPWLMSYADGAYRVRNIAAGVTHVFRLFDNSSSASNDGQLGVPDQSPSLGGSFVAATIPTGSLADTFGTGIEVGLSATVHHTGASIEYTWDTATGQMVRMRRSDDTILDITWDAAVNRVEGIEVSNPTTHPEDQPQRLISYEYDPYGQLIRVINSGDGALQYHYDEHGRVFGWTDRNGVSYYYRFDEFGRVQAQVGTGGLFPNILYWAEDHGDDAPVGGQVCVLIETAGEFQGDPLALGESVVKKYFNRLEQLPLYQALIEAGLKGAGLTGRGRTAARDDERWTVPEAWLHDELLGDIRPTVYRSTPAGDVWRIITPEGGVVDTTHNLYHQETSVTNAAGASTAFTYNDDGVLVATDHPNGLRSYIEAGTWGQPVRIVGTDGQVTECEVDAFGMTQSITDPTGAVTSYAYDLRSSGIVAASTTYPDGTTEDIDSDDAGRICAVTDAAGRRTSFTRDVRGLVVESIDPIGEIETYEYSPEGWPTAITHPDGTTITALYDGEGNRIATTNEIGATTTTDYTVFDKPIAITDATGATTHLDYNTQMQPVRVTNADGNTWSYTYDLDGMPGGEVDYNNIATTSTISADGLVTTLTTPAGTTTRTYHPDGRTDTITDALGTTRYFYTDTKRVARIEGPQATIDYTRDTYGRVTAETVTLPSGETTTHERSYAHAGHITAQHLTLPLGDTFTTGYGHDETGAIAATTHTHTPVGAEFSNLVAEFSYGVDARGLRNQLSTGSLIRTLTSDARERTTADTLTALDSAIDSGIRTISSRMFTWRGDSALESVTDYLRGATTYTLDILGRATGLTRSATSQATPAALNSVAGSEETYGFSPAGVLNTIDTPATPRPSSTTNAATYRSGAPRATTGATDQDNRVEFDGTMPTRVGRTTYTYDAAGRVIQTVTKRISKKPLVHHFYYATGVQPIGFTTSDEPGVGYRYVYDPYGRRVAKELIDASTGDVLARTVFAHVGDRLVAEQTTHDVSSTRPRIGAGYVWIHDPATGSLTGQITLTPTTTGSPTSTLAIKSHPAVEARFMLMMTDLAGAPQELVDPDHGTIGGYATQTLYGYRTWHGEHTSPLLYTGQYLDAESGWAYNRHRYYHPDAGSYNAQDPLGLAPRIASAQGYVDHAAHWIDALGLHSYNAGTPADDAPLERHPKYPERSVRGTYFGANSDAAYGNKMHEAYSAEKAAEGYITNRGLPNSRLRPDAYKMEGDYISEIREYKPDSDSGRAHARRQLKNYINHSEEYNRAIAAEAGPEAEPPKLKWYLDEYPVPKKKK